MKGIHIKRRAVSGTVGQLRVRSKLISRKTMVGSMDGNLLTVTVTDQKVSTQ